MQILLSNAILNTYFINHSRKEVGRKLRQVIKERGEKLLSAFEFLSKSEITPMELKRMHDFCKSQDRNLSVAGVALKNRVILSVAFYKSLSTSAEATQIANPSGYIPGVNSFLDNFIKHYLSNAEFRDSLVVHLMRGYVAKVEGVKNPKYGSKVLNFFMALAASGDKKGFEFVSGNLASVSLRWMKTLTSRKRSVPFISLDKKQMVLRVKDIMAKVRAAFGDQTKRLAITVGVDATCLVKAFQVCSSQGAIVGGASPKHFIPIRDNATKEELKDLLQECVDGKHGGLAAEVKCAVLSFQEAPPNMCPYFCLAGLPQSINESNDFGTDVVEACEEAAKEVGNLVVLNTSTDGVSCEVQWNLSVLVDYLQGKINYISLPDPNHNVKNLRGQMIGGVITNSYRELHLRSSFVEVCWCCKGTLPH